MPEACVSAGCALEPVLAAASAPAVWPDSAGCMAGWPGPAEAAPPFEPVGTETATGAGTGVESDADESGWSAGCSRLLGLRTALPRRRFGCRSCSLHDSWRCSFGWRGHACGFSSTLTTLRVAKHEAGSTKSEQDHTQGEQHGRAKGQFPVPGGPQALFRFLHRFKYRSAKPSLHICLWLTTFYATRKIPNLTWRCPPFRHCHLVSGVIDPAPAN